MKYLIFCALCVVVPTAAWAQILTTTPVFPTENDQITVYYNTTSGNGELAGAIPVYCHTGVITNNSSSNSDWQHVIGNWGTSDPNVFMTYVSPNVFSWSISPNVIQKYSLGAGETASRLMFVFRNASGSLVGRNADGSDIYIDLYQPGFNAGIIQPNNTQVIHPGDNLQIQAASSTASTITISNNGTQVAQQTGVTSLNYNFSTTLPGTYTITMNANDGTNNVDDTVTIIVLPDPTVLNAPTGTIDGINYTGSNSVRLQLYAPNKNYVFVIGDFNNWQPNLNYLMNKNTAGDTYWLDITGLDPNTEYRFQYMIDDEQMRIAEIYSDKILDPWNDQYIPTSSYPNLTPYPSGLTSQPVSTFKINQTAFNWTDQSYVRPPKERLVVYELLLRDFLANRNWQTLQDTLDYLDNLGITCIEMMPFNEFEGNESWGYNPSFYFAPDKYYGTKEALKSFVNECHLRGISVVQDIALNHSFGTNPMVRMYFDPSLGDYGEPTAENPWFNQVSPHPFGVGYDFNHESQRTKNFCKRVLAYWMQEFHIDGYRFDLSKGFTNTNSGSNVAAWNAYDQSRVNILTDYYNYMQSVVPGSYAILEHLGDNSEETVLASNGMMLWGKMTTQYEQAAMGYADNSDLSWGSYQSRGWSVPNLVSYGESHDEERIMYKCLNYGASSGSYNITQLNTALQRMAMCHVFLIPIPGPKMIWEFGEQGYAYSINYCTDGTNNTNCRTDAKPPRWDYMDIANRIYLYKVTAALNKLKKTQAVFSTTDYDIDLGGFGKRIHLNTPNMKAVVVGNFNVTAINMVPGFQHTGTWYDYFSHTSFQVDDLGASFNYQPGEYHLYTDQELDAPDLNVGIEEAMNFMKLDVLLYPNPASSQLTVGFDQGTPGVTRIQILDITGKVVKEMPARSFGTGNQVVELDLSSLGAQGYYFVRIATPSKVYTERFIKE